MTLIRLCRILVATCLGHASASAALLVFDRTVTEGSPYYTDVVLDRAGNVHLCGFASVDGVSRALVSKWSPDGTDELWSLQFGASPGQIATGIALDREGNVYVAGWTSDRGFPLKDPLQATFGGGETDLFILKINSSGRSLLYSTYLGGAGNDFANQIRVDDAGNIYVTGTTFSQDFPAFDSVRAGETDAFAIKLNPAGSELLYSRLLGGSANDLGNGLALDSAGRAYLIGSTQSTNFPVVSPFQAENHGGLDVFVAVLNSAGATEYASYLGGSLPESGTGIAVDASGNILLTGLTTSEDYPLAHAVQDTLRRGDCLAGEVCGDAFITKLNPSGSALVFSTYLGGNGPENLTAITSSIGFSFYGIGVDTAGFVYVTGTTESLDFPLVGGLQVSPRRGNSDPFLAKFQPDGGLVYSTCVAPGQFKPGENRLNAASSLAVNAGGEAVLAGVSLAPSVGPGAGTPAVGYFAKVFDLPVALTSVDPVQTEPGTIRFTGIHRLADSSSQLSFEVPTNSGYVVEGSTNLHEWTPLFTQPPPDGSDGSGGGKK